MILPGLSIPSTFPHDLDLLQNPRTDFTRGHFAEFL
jgi:hypothetical protein